MQQKSLTTEQMLPSNFSGKPPRMFYVEIPGLDSFLIAAVQKPILGRGQPKEIIVEVHDTVAPSSEQQLRAILAAQSKWWKSQPKRNIHLKQADVVGTILSETIFHNVKLIKLRPSKLSYDDRSGLGSFLATFSYQREEFLY